MNCDQAIVQGRDLSPVGILRMRRACVHGRDRRLERVPRPNLLYWLASKLK
jgi:hypothetical protein